MPTPPFTRHDAMLNPGDQPAPPPARRAADNLFLALFAWSVIFFVVGVEMLLPVLLPLLLPEAKLRSQRVVVTSNVEFEMLARFHVGLQRITQNAGPQSRPPSITANAIADLRSKMHNAVDSVHLIALAAELGDMTTAMSELDAILANEMLPKGLRGDAKALDTIYRHGGPDKLDEAARTRLLSRHHWFGDLALAHGKPDSDPHRQAVMGPAMRTCVGMIAVVIVGGLLAVIALGLFVAAVLALAMGKLGSNYGKAVPSAPGIVARLRSWGTRGVAPKTAPLEIANEAAATPAPVLAVSGTAPEPLPPPSPELMGNAERLALRPPSVTTAPSSTLAQEAVPVITARPPAVAEELVIVDPQPIGTDEIAVPVNANVAASEAPEPDELFGRKPDEGDSSTSRTPSPVKTSLPPTIIATPQPLATAPAPEPVAINLPPTPVSPVPSQAPEAPQPVAALVTTPTTPANTSAAPAQDALQEPAPKPRRVPYLEAFAIYLLTFMGFSLVLSLVWPTAPLSITWVYLPMAIGVAAWPLLRGVKFADYRHAVGLHRGRGIFAEIGCGLAGYVAGLPLVLAGFIITFLLVLAQQQIATALPEREPTTAAATLPDAESKPTTSAPRTPRAEPSIANEDFLVAPPGVRPTQRAAMPTHPIINDLKPGSGAMGFIGLFLLAAVWAPVIEELFFRGMLYHHLRGRFGWMLSAIFVGFIFAAIHPQGWTAIPVLGAIAFVLASIREWRGSLIGPIVAHAFNNGTLVAFMFLLLG